MDCQTGADSRRVPFNQAPKSEDLGHPAVLPSRDIDRKLQAMQGTAGEDAGPLRVLDGWRGRRALHQFAVDSSRFGRRLRPN